MPTIAIDIDGVCADFVAGLRPLAARRLGVPPDQLADPQHYDLRCWGLADGGWDTLDRSGLYRQLPPIGAAATTIRRLHEQGWRIRFVTARCAHEPDRNRVAADTVEWLGQHQFRWDDLCFTTDKGAVAADIYIDDSPTEILRLRDTGRAAVVYDQPYNQRVDGPRLPSWAAITDTAGRWLEQAVEDHRTVPDTQHQPATGVRSSDDSSEGAPTVVSAARIAFFHLAAATGPGGWCSNVCGRCARRPAYKVARSRQLHISADGLLVGRDGWPNAGRYGQFDTSRVYAVYDQQSVTCESCAGQFRAGHVACGECDRIR